MIKSKQCKTTQNTIIVTHKKECVSYENRIFIKMIILKSKMYKWVFIAHWIFNILGFTKLMSLSCLEKWYAK